MKNIMAFVALILLFPISQSFAGTTKIPISAGGPAVAIGILSAIGIDPLGLGLAGSSSTAPSASLKGTTNQNDFQSLASLPGSYDLLNQSAGSSLTTLDILK